jgi:hypothetical protein
MTSSPAFSSGMTSRDRGGLKRRTSREDPFFGGLGPSDAENWHGLGENNWGESIPHFAGRRRAILLPVRPICVFIDDGGLKMVSLVRFFRVLFFVRAKEPSRRSYFLSRLALTPLFFVHNSILAVTLVPPPARDSGYGGEAACWAAFPVRGRSFSVLFGISSWENNFGGPGTDSSKARGRREGGGSPVFFDLVLGRIRPWHKARLGRQ